MSGRVAFVVVAVCVTVAAAIGYAVGNGASHLAGVPVALVCMVVAFGIQWLAFVPAYRQRTEHFYDLTGSVTYITVIWLSVIVSGTWSLAALTIAAMVTVWAGRLGTFLFKRVRRDGKDGRFDEIKHSAPRFLVAWTLQGLWVSLTLAAALVVTTAQSPAPPSPALGAGVLVWLVGFAIEVIADRQKSAFRRKHPGRFIDSGLWSWSRHPNYFGEIVLWIGIALMASASMSGWSWMGWVSPVFVVLLLTRISGIPMLEARADARYGSDPAFRRYKAQTSALIPLPPRQTDRAERVDT